MTDLNLNHCLAPRILVFFFLFALIDSFRLSYHTYDRFLLEINVFIFFRGYSVLPIQLMILYLAKSWTVSREFVIVFGVMMAFRR